MLDFVNVDFKGLKDLSDVQSAGAEFDCIIDWVQATFMNRCLDDVLKIFGLKYEDLVVVDRGLYGYNSTLVFGEKIKFMYLSQKMPTRSDLFIPQVRGVFMLLSGYACREFELKYSWDFMIDVLNLPDVNVGRIDIAWDSFTKVFWDIKRIERSLTRGNVTSKWKKGTVVKERIVKDGSIAGHSVRFGSGHSETMLIFYDKLEERKANDYDVDPDVKHWNRMELRVRDDSAKRLVMILQGNLDNASRLCMSVVNRYIAFKDENDHDSNKSRRKDAFWWSEFINSTDKLVLAKRARQTTINKKKDWYNAATPKTFASIFLSEIDDLDEMQLTEYVKLGIKRLQTMDLNMINAHRIEYGASIITKEKFIALKNRLLFEVHQDPEN